MRSLSGSRSHCNWYLLAIVIRVEVLNPRRRNSVHIMTKALIILSLKAESLLCRFSVICMA